MRREKFGWQEARSSLAKQQKAFFNENQLTETNRQKAACLLVLCNTKFESKIANFSKLSRVGNLVTTNG